MFIHKYGNIAINDVKIILKTKNNSTCIDFDLSTPPTLSEIWFKENNLAKKPPLGMFYYNEEQPPFLLWESIVGDAYEDFYIDMSNNLSESYPDRFTPDVDVRTYRSKNGLKSVPYKYYDIDLQSQEYYENTAPSELEFYFYPRES